MSCSKVLTVVSSDNERFEIKESIAMQSGILKLMIEDGCFEGEIPLTNVTSKILCNVIDWCNKHGEEDKKDQEMLMSREKEFINGLTMDDLFNVLLASHYLDVKSLVDCACRRIVDLMKGRTPEQIREIFNIVNDYSFEEEAEVRQENRWAFSS